MTIDNLTLIMLLVNPAISKMIDIPHTTDFMILMSFVSKLAI